MIIPFMKIRWLSLSFSLLLIGHLSYHTYAQYGGLKLGLDFSGGIKLEVKAADQITIEKLRTFFKKQKIEAVVQDASKEDRKTIKIELGSKQDSLLEEAAEKNTQQLELAGLSVSSVDYLKWILVKNFVPKNPSDIEFINADKVGPTIGTFLKESAIKLLLVSLVLITLYVTFRFQFNFALGALAALMHDLIMTVGFIGYFQIPLSVPVIAALLTILGYSINDTIVIFDRIRENIGGGQNISIESVVDKSITASISRTLITSITTLVAVGAVYFWGGEGLNDMALVLMIGVIIGTYSSPFIASPVVTWGEKLLPVRS